MTRIWLLSVLLSVARGFQVPVIRLPKRGTLVPLSLGGDPNYISLDTFHALNGAMETRNVVMMGGSSSGVERDPSLAMTCGLITASLFGIALANPPPPEAIEETSPSRSIPVKEDTATELSSGPNDSSKDRAKTALGAVDSEKEIVNAMVTPETKDDVQPRMVFATNTENIQATKSIASTEDPKKETAIEHVLDLIFPNDDLAGATKSTSTEEAKQETAIEHVLDLFFAEDDLSREERKALKAFDDRDREELVACMLRVVGLVRTARIQWNEERDRRNELQRVLNQATEKIVQLQNNLEQEQNKVVLTTQELDETKAFLAATREHLRKVIGDNSQMMKERNSFRKLGRAAWHVSKAPLKQFLRKKSESFG